MILSHLVITLPIMVWIMIGDFEDMPQELEEAALIDGAPVASPPRNLLPLAGRAWRRQRS